MSAIINFGSEEGNTSWKRDSLFYVFFVIKDSVNEGGLTREVASVLKYSRLSEALNGESRNKTWSKHGLDL